MSTHICERCAKSFEYSGNVKRCETCRISCQRCEAPVTNGNSLCDKCRHATGVKARSLVKCKHPGCDRMLRSSDMCLRSGYCSEHYDKTERGKRLAHYNKTVKSKPDHLHYRTQNDRTADCTCVVCGKSFKALVGTVKYNTPKHGHCCSSRCVGINAAKHTPRQRTSIERAIENALQRYAISYQTQVPLCGVTLADFYLPDHGIVIFCDGEYWHSLPKRQQGDKRQDQVLQANGFTVYRFTEHDIKQSPDACINRLCLEVAPPFLQLSLPICE